MASPANSSQSPAFSCGRGFYNLDANSGSSVAQPKVEPVTVMSGRGFYNPNANSGSSLSGRATEATSTVSGPAASMSSKASYNPNRNSAAPLSGRVTQRVEDSEEENSTKNKKKYTWQMTPEEYRQYLWEIEYDCM